MVIFAVALSVFRVIQSLVLQLWSSDVATHLLMLCSTGSSDETVRLWSSTGQAIATLEGHTDTVDTVAWSADGTLASGGSLCVM